MRNKDAEKAWLAAFGDDEQYEASRRIKWPSCMRISTRMRDSPCLRIPLTALKWAEDGRWDGVFQTLRLGCCSVNVRIPYFFGGKRFVHYAAVQGRVDVLRVLCNKFQARLCIRDGFRSTPLMCAVYYHQLEAARWLCQCPTLDLYARTLRNETALDLARRRLHDVDAAMAACIAAAMHTRARWSGLRAAWFTAGAHIFLRKRALSLFISMDSRRQPEPHVEPEPEPQDLPQIRYMWSHELPADRSQYVWWVDKDDDVFNPEDPESCYMVRVAPARCLSWDQQLTGHATAPLGAAAGLPGLRECAEGLFEVDTSIRTLQALVGHMHGLGFDLLRRDDVDD